VPDMERRNIMNLILLFGGVLPAVGGLAIPYILFFIPRSGGGGGGGLPALTKAGDKVTFTSWLKDHQVGSRELVQGLKGDATYLIVDEGSTIRDYGINAVCTHLGCVVPWNKARPGADSMKRRASGGGRFRATLRRELRGHVLGARRGGAEGMCLVQEGAGLVMLRTPIV